MVVEVVEAGDDVNGLAVHAASGRGHDPHFVDDGGGAEVGVGIADDRAEGTHERVFALVGFYAANDAAFVSCFQERKMGLNFWNLILGC